MAARVKHDAGLRADVEGGVARITLDRPERRNAFDEALIAALTGTLEALAQDGRVRAVVLGAAGPSFCAGADLGWLKRAASFGWEQNLADAANLTRMMAVLDTLPKPTVALVRGEAFGGGAGLVAAADIAIAARDARFSFAEAKLGLIPAAVSPYALRAIGARAARRYFLSAEVFDAAEAHRLGLVHAVVEAVELEGAGEAIVDALLAAGPEAQAAAKALIRDVASHPVDSDLIAETARRFAEIRASDEAREGMDAFLGKRRPRWTAR